MRERDDARDKAIGMLAALLAGDGVYGARLTVVDSMAMGSQRVTEDPHRTGMRARAAEAMRVIGLVAIDAALLEEIRAARALEDRVYGNGRAMVAKNQIVRSVLAQTIDALDPIPPAPTSEK